ncbi:hypothetical protein FPV67DRAFT_1672317 [Lyophyllum atratum]|nr:hypothetical protein FPV67DRAFT_1672317 [Lyophyllum atratum]
MTSSISSQSHSSWYDGTNLTIPEYLRSAALNPPTRVPLTPEQLKSYVRKYVHYVQLAEEQDEAMRGDPAQIPVAYAQAMEILAREQRSKKSIALCTYADIHATLDDLAEKCKRTPRTFVDRILLSAYALNYVLLMKDHVLRHPTRAKDDVLKVIRMANERLARMDVDTRGQWEGASLNETPQTIVLIPHSRRGNLQTVTPDHIIMWRANPPLLVGIGFMNKSSDNPYEAENGVFFVRDFLTGARGSSHFEVQFENSGEDIFPFSPDQLFELIKDAGYVRVQ